jgi:anti-sigma28 factor (negative regulator of flagellin synthesis)
MTFNVTFTLNTYPLTVTVVGVGTVTSNPPGFDCGSDCSEIYDHGTIVTLTAIPTGTSSFAGWSGDCTGTDLTCTIFMNSNKIVTATFGLKQGKKVQTPSLLPLAANTIATAKNLLTQAEDLLKTAHEKNLDTASCERLVEEAKVMLTKAEQYMTSPTTSIYFANQAIAKLKQAIECLKALLG